MPDFKAALALAKQNLAVSSGNGGYSGYAREKASANSQLQGARAVTTTAVPLVTVVTSAEPDRACNHSGQPVTTAVRPLVTLERDEKAEHVQRSSSPVTAVTSVTTDFEQTGAFPVIPPAWFDGVLSLSMSDEPCPGFRSRAHWLRTYDALHDFIASPHAAEAARLGWSAELLFGVHPVVGLGNVANCGALIIADRQPIEAVEVDVIRLGKMMFYQPPMAILSIPVWSFTP